MKAKDMLKHFSPEEQMKKIVEIASKIIKENNWQHKVSSKQNRNI